MQAARETGAPFEHGGASGSAFDHHASRGDSGFTWPREIESRERFPFFARGRFLVAIVALARQDTSDQPA